jgi:hypothetical protein
LSTIAPEETGSATAATDCRAVSIPTVNIPIEANTRILAATVCSLGFYIIRII